ncbi:hypothetical protein CONCODRAFT_3951 [Conidiobolus coronatus NRRL 28638]|uniref:ABC transporter domain-containing protein n=1 Tax=Conidiobolus coronatus (strain ATCC 28846 / CBS 209.66 / NRRL 28638) TaxID=796925 RepID=A0A137PE63_CONC2|nr:hypothetical protein CONCODRAFT_3951 [Conidiobolus coronatus NRRL 28638]|eukprot:KXN73270.1 hypothetical protein CONCODRAFT_3951 [Conidiobolus coronatus NRRL 28638]
MVEKRRRTNLVAYTIFPQEDLEKEIHMTMSDFLGTATGFRDKIEYRPQSKLKDAIFQEIVEFVTIEGYPDASIPPTNEVVIQDFTSRILTKVIWYIIQENKKLKLRLEREREIISKDEARHGFMEFVLMQRIQHNSEDLLLIIEAKRDAIGKGLKQCMLAIKDAFEINSKKRPMYGFVTTGIDWQLICYDGEKYSAYDKLIFVIGNIINRKEQWVDECSILVDLLYSIIPIVIKNTCFSWEESDEYTSLLNDLTLTTKKGELVAVVGHVGSGKSTLLAALLGQMSQTRGTRL